MKGKLLIVDDEENIRDSLSSHFRFLEYEVETAANGKDALEKLDSYRAEVVISDIVMPVMNGVDLLRKIRDVHPMIRVIMITGYVTQENALTCMRYHADTLIFKPFEDLEILEKSVERSLSNLANWTDILRQLHDIKPGGQRS